MKILRCKYCGKEFETDGSKAMSNKITAQHVRLCELNPNRQRLIDALKRGAMTMNRKRLEAVHQKIKLQEATRKPREFICVKCGAPYYLELTDLEYQRILTDPQKYFYRKHCTRKCANSHFLSLEEIQKRNQKKEEQKQLKLLKNAELIKKPRNITEETRQKLSEAGKRSAAKMSELRRSKNEIYFCELCQQTFNNVGHNQPIFNGWDADVLLYDYKIAVLWNGKWHYVEIMKKKNTLKSIQNRDRIKQKEILAANWNLYIIKDMGKHNKKFVEQEFEKFKIYVNYINQKSFIQKS